MSRNNNGLGHGNAVDLSMSHPDGVFVLKKPIWFGKTWQWEAFKQGFSEHASTKALAIELVTAKVLGLESEYELTDGDLLELVIA